MSAENIYCRIERTTGTNVTIDVGNITQFPNSFHRASRRDSNTIYMSDKGPNPYNYTLSRIDENIGVFSQSENTLLNSGSSQPGSPIRRKSGGFTLPNSKFMLHWVNDTVSNLQIFQEPFPFTFEIATTYTATDSDVDKILNDKFLYVATNNPNVEFRVMEIINNQTIQLITGEELIESGHGAIRRVLFMGDGYGLFANGGTTLNLINSPELSIPTDDFRFIDVNSDSDKLYVSYLQEDELRVQTFAIDDLMTPGMITPFGASNINNLDTNVHDLRIYSITEGILTAYGRDGNDKQVHSSFDAGESFSDVSEGAWAGQVVKLINVGNDSIILLDNGEMYLNDNLGWSNIATLSNIPINAAHRRISDKQEIFVSPTTNDIIEYSPNLGLSTVDVSDTVGTVNQIVESHVD